MLLYLFVVDMMIAWNHYSEEMGFSQYSLRLLLQ